MTQEQNPVNSQVQTPIDPTDSHGLDKWLDQLVAELHDRGENGVNGSPSDTESVYAYETMGRAGLIGMSWPVELGGRDIDPIDALVAEERFGYHWLPLCGYSLSVKTIGNSLLRFGSRELQEEFLPRIASGQISFCQGYSEPGAGSDLAALTTRAEYRDGSWVVNGRKIWTSSAEYADWMYTAVRTNLDEPRHRGLSVMLLDMKSPGVTVTTHSTLGGGTLGEVVLEDVKVSPDHVVGEIDKGWATLMGTLDYERVTSEKVGVAMRVIDELRPLISGTHSLQLLAIEGELNACRRLGHLATQQLTNGESSSRASSMCKLSISLLIHRLASLAVEALGPEALIDETNTPTRRAMFAAFHRSSVSMMIAGGSADVQRKVIAQQGLGLPRAAKRTA